jgi:hypothetical protein
MDAVEHAFIQVAPALVVNELREFSDAVGSESINGLCKWPVLRASSPVFNIGRLKRRKLDRAINKGRTGRCRNKVRD